MAIRKDSDNLLFLEKQECSNIDQSIYHLKITLANLSVDGVLKTQRSLQVGKRFGKQCKGVQNLPSEDIGMPSSCDPTYSIALAARTR
jgi:hypothetical protein